MKIAEDPEQGKVNRMYAAEALGKLGSQPAHLAALRARLDPKIEPVAAVQNRAWESYRQNFLKLPAAEQRTVLDSWSGPDPTLVV